MIVRGPSWKHCTLNELGTLARGKSRHRPRNDPSLYGGRWPFVQTGDIKEAGLTLYRYSQTYSDAGLAQSKLWPVGTLCITIAANIADTAILGIQACFPDSVVGFLPDPDQADVRFVKYAIDHWKQRLTDISRGTTQDNLSVDKLLSQRLPVPDLDTQRRIAGILSAYDDLIENNERRIAILEDMARRVFREWFVDFRFPGHEGVRMVDTEAGRIPEGWERRAFTDVAEVLSGGTPKKDRAEFWDGSIPFFTPRDAPDRTWSTQTDASITEIGLRHCNSALYPERTVFVTARGTVGRLALASKPMAMNQSCYALQGRGFPQLFLLEFTRSAVDRLRTMSTGAVFDTIIVDTFRKLLMLTPPPALACDYDRWADPLFSMSKTLTLANGRLRASRDLLLPRLISGELNVASAEKALEAAE